MPDGIQFLTVAELADGFAPGIGDDGLIGLAVGIVRQVDGGGPEDHLKTGGSQDRGHDARCPFLHPYAVLQKCHRSVRSFRNLDTIFQCLGIKLINRPAPAVHLFHGTCKL